MPVETDTFLPVPHDSIGPIVKEPETDWRPPGFDRLMHAAQAPHYRLAFCVLASLLTGMFLLVVLHGPCMEVIYGQDALGFLNSAWKIRNGVLPSAGYPSALGALNAWIFAAAMWVLGPTAAVLPFCNAAMAAAIGLLGWVVARRRLPAFPALLYALTFALVACVPHRLHFDYYASTYDCYYNRQGYALSAILALLLFLPRRLEEGNGARGLAVDGRLVGMIVGVLFYLKISYFMAAVGLCAVAMVGRREYSKVLWGNALVVSAAVFVAGLPLIGYDLAAMLRDLQQAASVRRGNPITAFTLPRLFSGLPMSALAIALLAVVQFALRPVGWLWRRRAGDEAAADEAPGWAELAGLVAICLFISMTNAPGGDYFEDPLLSGWLFVLLGIVLRRTPAEGSVNRRPAVRQDLPVLCGLLAVFWIYSYGASLHSFCYSFSPWQTAWQQSMTSSAARIDSASLESMVLPGYGGGVPMPYTYTQKINDGLRLLRKLGGGHRVETFDFVNPFPFALQWPAVHGGFWVWQDGFSFSEASHPTTQQVFSDADVLMIPKYPAIPDSFKLMIQLYGGYIKEHYRLRDASDQWMVLVRQ